MTAVRTKVKTRSDIPRLLRRFKKQSMFNLFRASAFIRTVARRSIRRRKTASAAGTPPHTRKGELKNAILFAADGEEEAVIGPSAKMIGQAGAAHEHGGRFKGDDFDRRAFMGPALEKSQDKLPKFWAASVK